MLKSGGAGGGQSKRSIGIRWERVDVEVRKTA